MKRRPRVLCGLSAAALALSQTPRLMPIPAALQRPVTPSVEFTDRNGETLREVRVEERFVRTVDLHDVPDSVIHAMLAAEDKRFFQHRGMDWLRLARAAFSNVQRGRVVSGASTITQQLVKISEPRPRTLKTKVVEVLTALRLEQLWTKDEILAAYLSRVDFGNLNTGIASASAYYFDKPLADLTHAEAAFLAGLPRAPSRLNPHRNIAAAKRRQHVVLERMDEAGWLTPEQHARARSEALALRPQRRAFRTPHFVDLVTSRRRREGSTQTTLDLGVQSAAEGVVRARLLPLKAQDVGNAAVVVIDNQSGDVLAMVGSADFYDPVAGQVNGAWAPRSAGSTLKPFTYLLALERGATPATVFADIPAAFRTSTGMYRPANFNHRCRGPVRMRLALANSLNIPAVRALSEYGGPAALHQRLCDWGITTLPRPAHEY
ncbi:MAG: transglycosylase domain-containing protein, partial [Chthoniobacteraceae bacterium]